MTQTMTTDPTSNQTFPSPESDAEFIEHVITEAALSPEEERRLRGLLRLPGMTLLPAKATIAEAEKKLILTALERHNGSTSKAAKDLGISVRKIQYRLRDWRLQSAQFQAGSR